VRQRKSRPTTSLERAFARTVTLCGWLALACGSGSNEYTAAAVAAGVTVLATGVNRAVTGNCWASCAPGYVCDRKSGICERAECAPGCPVGRHCVRELDGSFHCAEDVGAVSFGAMARRRQSAAASANPSASPLPTSRNLPLADAGAPLPTIEAGAAGTAADAGDAGPAPNPR